jgi:hypothetical protein
MVSNTSHVILVTVTLVCAAVIISAAAGALLPLPVFAQQEETSLGERENIASGIVSGVLDGSLGGDVNNEEDKNGDADFKSNQDASVSATIDPNQEDNNNNVQFGDNTNPQIAVPITDQDTDQRAANVGLNEALDVTAEQTPTPEDGQPPECPLIMTTAKEVYEPGDEVAITVTNTGDEPLDFPNSALDLQIKNVDTGEVFPLEAAQVITTLEPGESRTFEFTYEELVTEIETGTIEASIGCSNVDFTLAPIIIS